MTIGLSAECGSVFSFLCLLPCTVFLLMRPSLLTWLCTSLSAGLPRWSFHALFLSSSPARDLQQKTWRLCFCLLEVGIHCTWQPSCCLLEVGHQQNLDFASSHHLGHLCFSWHVWTSCSFLRNFDLFMKLFVITSTRSFQDVHISSGTNLV